LPAVWIYTQSNITSIVLFDGNSEAWMLSRGLNAWPVGPVNLGHWTWAFELHPRIVL
jgi:hypothetical protein